MKNDENAAEWKENRSGAEKFNRETFQERFFGGVVRQWIPSLVALIDEYSQIVILYVMIILENNIHVFMY